MKCSYCNKNVKQKLNFKNIFSKKTEILCDKCKKIFFLNKENININYTLYYFAKYKDIKEDIYKIKYFGDVAISLKYKKIIKNFFKEHKFDLILIAPTNNTREAIRGFNHIEIICRLCEISFFDIFEKKYRKKQSKKNNERTLHETKIKKEFLEKIKSATEILIIDDIFTSGNTLNSLANEVKKINNSCKISFLTLAKSK